MSEFWVPKKKYELISNLSLMYPGIRSTLESMSKAQLYAIFYRIRKKHLTKIK